MELTKAFGGNKFFLSTISFKCHCASPPPPPDLIVEAKRIDFQYTTSEIFVPLSDCIFISIHIKENDFTIIIIIIEKFNIFFMVLLSP